MTDTTMVNADTGGNPYSATTMIAIGMKRLSPFKKLPTYDELRKERCELLLNAFEGRDFTLVTSAGVEFKIHSIMLIGGPKSLAQDVFPPGTTSTRPRLDHVDLPPYCLPLLVDRLVAFLYTSHYSLDANGTVTTLHHHTNLPSGASATSFALSMKATEFHIHMYGLAEMLDYPALKSMVFGRLVQYFVHEAKDVTRVKDLIRIVFEPADSPKRACKDEGDALKELSIAAVLVHEEKHWHSGQVNEFRYMIADELDQDAWKCYRAWYKKIKDANAGLLAVRAGEASTSKGNKINRLTHEALASSMGNNVLSPYKPSLKNRPKLSLGPGANKAPTTPKDPPQNPPKSAEQIRKETTAMMDLMANLHLCFDEYAYWHLSALQAKTGASEAALKEALPKMADLIRSGPFAAMWKRLPMFDRPSSMHAVAKRQVLEAGPRVSTPSTPRMHDALPRRNVATGRPITTPGRKALSTPPAAGPEAKANAGATAMMASEWAPGKAMEGAAFTFKPRTETFVVFEPLAGKPAPLTGEQLSVLEGGFKQSDESRKAKAGEKKVGEWKGKENIAPKEDGGEAGADDADMAMD